MHRMRFRRVGHMDARPKCGQLRSGVRPMATEQWLICERPDCEGDPSECRECRLIAQLAEAEACIRELEEALKAQIARIVEARHSEPEDAERTLRDVEDALAALSKGRQARHD
jgi:hypothetical protein